MSAEVTPSSSSELTELGKCLMKQEVRLRAKLLKIFREFGIFHPSSTAWCAQKCNEGLCLQEWNLQNIWEGSLLCLQDICTALLITAFISLSWKDTLSCQRTTTQLCWPLLKQVFLLKRLEGVVKLNIPTHCQSIWELWSTNAGHHFFWVDKQNCFGLPSCYLFICLP